MRRSIQKTLLTFFVLLFLSMLLLSQAADSRAAWVKRVVDDNMLLFTNVTLTLVTIDPAFWEGT
jgi:hypothetical protein